MDEKKSYSDYLREKFPPKARFVERMRNLLGDEVGDFFDVCYLPTPDSIRCNTLKISVPDLLKRLRGYGWEVRQPFMPGWRSSALPEKFASRRSSSLHDGEVHASCGGLEFQEVFIIESKLGPGELGKTKEHLLGYYYVQDISSMLPGFVLNPKNGDFVLDLCASPGSKTTQMASMMENGGTIIANEVSMGRVGILNSNLERCGVSNVIVTRKEGVAFCEKLLRKSRFRFDKILVDAPCSGEGTLRKSPKTFLMWNENMIKKMAGVQKRLAGAAMKLLKVGGTMVYSTCTLAPEENEGVVDYLVKNFDVVVEEISLPLKFRCGVTAFGDMVFDDSVKKCLRLYPQDNDTDGFFVAKLRKVGEREKLTADFANLHGFSKEVRG